MNTDQLKTWNAISGAPGTYYVNASESERTIMRDWIRGLLQEREVRVDFEKTNGEFRSMKCTLNAELGAKYTVNESKPTKQPNPDVCVVWDVAQQAWRSFRWDRVKKIQFELG
jgi:hypothetical protein